MLNRSDTNNHETSSGALTIAPPYCAEKARLDETYGACLMEYSRAVSDLAKSIAALPREEYQRFWQFTEAARAKSDSARTDLERHIAEHGC